MQNQDPEEVESWQRYDSQESRKMAGHSQQKEPSHSRQLFQTLGTSSSHKFNQLYVDRLKNLNSSFKIDNRMENESNIFRDLAKEMEKIEKQTMSNTFMDKSFRLLNIIPSRLDLNEENPFVRACKVRGTYDSIEHYLDVQFRLLREDFLIPLRNGFKEYLSGDETMNNSDLRIYKNVKLLNWEMHDYGIGHKLSFDKTKYWHGSKSFMYGSLLLLSRDNFETMLFAIVSGCCQKQLEEGYVLIEACAGSNITPDLLGNSNFIALESKIFFEPYHQVLKAMKNIKVDKFPMEAYLIKAKSDVDLPAYLAHKPELSYKGLPIRLDGSWPSAEELGMDDPQLDAFKSAITQEFAIIQGPPGTGKTFLASQIVSVLLENECNWLKYGPIVVVCLTNHALDQFLENILQYTSSVVRVGSRSKSAALKRHSLLRKREVLSIGSRSSAMMVGPKIAIKHHFSDINRYRLIKSYLTARNVIVPLGCLFYRFSSTYFKSDQDLIYWLSRGLIVNQKITVQRDLGYTDREDDHNNNYNSHKIKTEEDLYTSQDVILTFVDVKKYVSLIHTYPLDIIDDEITSIKSQIETLKDTNDITMLENRVKVLNEKRDLFEREFDNHPLINATPGRSIDPRWKAYWMLIERTSKFLDEQIMKVEAKCRQRRYEIDECKLSNSFDILKKQKVVGLTTTCAARMQETLRALRAPIVIVEEAAEIMEAHVVCSITEDCQHVILIGDHKQLRPKTSVYELGMKYNLNVSLFERMVNIRGECSQLAYQHRMRPEISRLITPSIYEKLYNHGSVNAYPNIKGLEKNVFFIDHENHEKTCTNEETWKNDHEVHFFLSLAKHLVLQGYEPSDITILCTYSGQYFTFMKEMKNDELIKDVWVTTVDSYQGEENKIILLSLVRNNTEGDIGFLKEENRVCVALSRAKEGLYIMGNMKNLVTKNKIWPKIRDVLEKDDAIGDTLRLRCQIHLDQCTEVRMAYDFNKCPEGGCSKMCNWKFKCGHTCPKACHVMDQEHKKYHCMEDCTKSCPSIYKHPCPLKCCQDCEPCKVIEKKQLQCGHILDVPCFVNPNLSKCHVIVNVIMPGCNHIVAKPCYQSIEEVMSTHRCEIPLRPGF